MNISKGLEDLIRKLALGVERVKSDISGSTIMSDTVVYHQNGM